MPETPEQLWLGKEFEPDPREVARQKRRDSENESLDREATKKKAFAAASRALEYVSKRIASVSINTTPFSFGGESKSKQFWFNYLSAGATRHTSGYIRQDGSDPNLFHIEPDSKSEEGMKTLKEILAIEFKEEGLRVDLKYRKL